MSDKIPGEVHNELRAHFKKGESMTYLKELCETYKNNIEEFTCTAMKSAYDYNRAKALDYMLKLPGRHEATLLLKLNIPNLLIEDKFEKNIKMFAVICRNFPKELVKEEIQKARENPHVKLYLNMKNKEDRLKEYEARQKEILLVLLTETFEENPIKVKPNKI